MIQKAKDLPQNLIYLDNNATTPLDPRVVAAMQESLSHFWGNPSSVHVWGQKARSIIQSAQRSIAAYLGVAPQHLIFTSGATESLNLAIRGICKRYQTGHILTSSIEHPAVETTLSDLEKQGFTITRIPVGEDGAVEINAVETALRSDTCLMVFMAANNETGVKNDMASLLELAEQSRIPLVIDGVALLGKEILSSELLQQGPVVWCFSAHKIHGPLGIGITVVAPKVRLEPLITGGMQQYGRRGGTENLLAIVGAAEAFVCLKEALPAVEEKMRFLRDYFEQKLIESLPNVSINGSGSRVVNTSNLAFEGIDSESLFYLLDQHGVAASMGSACSSGALEPSRVLLQMGYSRERAMASIRFSLGRQTTLQEIEIASQIIITQVQKLRCLKRNLSP